MFPYAFLGRFFQVTDRLKELDCAKDYKDRIVKIHEKGGMFCGLRQTLKASYPLQAGKKMQG